MKSAMVTVVCDDPSHGGRIAIIGRLPEVNERLVDDTPVDRADLFGTLAVPPARPELVAASRSRRVLECKCGLRLELRGEKARAINEKLLAAGLERITLAQLIRYSH